MVVGGTDGTQSMCTTEVLDMVENNWRPGPTMTFCRGNVSVAVVGDKLWAVGGFSGKNFLNNVEFLDPIKDEWTTYLPVNDNEEDQPPSTEDQEPVVNGVELTETEIVAENNEEVVNGQGAEGE